MAMNLHIMVMMLMIADIGIIPMAVSRHPMRPSPVPFGNGIFRNHPANRHFSRLAPLVRNEKVAGSTPVGSTIQTPCLSDLVQDQAACQFTAQCSRCGVIVKGLGDWL